MPSVRVDRTHFSPDIGEFIALLHKHLVHYVVVGGEAVIFHGHARLTGDVDFFFDPDSANADRLFAALTEFWDGEVPGVHGSEELMHPGLILQFGIPPNRIDLINDVDNVAFADAWATRVQAVLVTPSGDVPMFYMSVEQLVKNKEATARPKDLDDLTYLRRKPSTP